MSPFPEVPITEAPSVAKCILHIVEITAYLAIIIKNLEYATRRFEHFVTIDSSDAWRLFRRVLGHAVGLPVEGTSIHVRRCKMLQSMLSGEVEAASSTSLEYFCLRHAC